MSLLLGYQAGKGVEDAKIFIFNTLYKHLDKPNAHARLLFGDFSSAFNYTQPCLLIKRLISDFKLSHQLVLLILDLLTNRQQRVFVNGCLSDIVVTNTGSQVCVLPPLLYILYTDSYRSSCDGSFLVKFSDDTVLLSLLRSAQHDHGVALPAFVDWCKDNFLELNASKTKDMVIDFRHNKQAFTESVMDGEKIEIVSSYKYLGTVFDNQLKFDVNTKALVKRGQQRIHLLRMLNYFSEFIFLSVQ